jgi:hypothetical protein
MMLRCVLLSRGRGVLEAGKRGAVWLGYTRTQYRQGIAAAAFGLRRGMRSLVITTSPSSMCTCRRGTMRSTTHDMGSASAGGTRTRGFGDFGFLDFATAARV